MSSASVSRLLEPASRQETLAPPDLMSTATPRRTQDREDNTEAGEALTLSEQVTSTTPRRRTSSSPASSAAGRIPEWHGATLKLCCDHLSLTAKSSKKKNQRPASRQIVPAMPSSATLTTTAPAPDPAVGSDATTPTQSHPEEGLPILSDISALFVSGRLSGVVNCCGTDSAYDLLSALAGWEAPSSDTVMSGNLVMNGTPVTAPSYQARAVFLDDDFAPLEDLTVKENLDYALALRVATTSQAYTTDDVLDELALASVKHAMLRDCNAYTRRRVMLGKELLLNPMVLLLDHPLSGLATHEARQFLTLLRRIASPHMQAAPTRATRARSDRGTSSSFSGATAVAVTPAAAASGATAPQLSPSSASSPLLPPSLRQPRVVVLSLVQPRWVVLQLLDDITLLVRDRIVYCGPREGLFKAPLLEAQNRGPTRRPHGGERAPLAVTVSRRSGSRRDRGLSLSSPATAAIQNTNNNNDATRDHFTYSTVVLQERQRELFLQEVYEAASAFTPSSPSLSVPPVSRDCDSGSINTTAAGEEVPDMTRADEASREAMLVAAMASTGNAAAVRVELDCFLRDCAAGVLSLEGWPHVPPSSAQQFVFLCFYELLQLRHGAVTRCGMVVVASLLSVLLAWLYSRQDGQAGMQTRVGILFFLVSSTFLNTLLSTNAVRREYTRFQRHRAQGYYSTLTYVSHRFVTDIVLRFGVGTCIALVVFVCSNFGGAWQDASVFELMVVLVLTSLCGSMTALLTCSACALLPSVRVSVDQFVLLAVYTGNLLFAGLVLNLTSMPAVVRGLSFSSVTRLAFESCVLTQFRGRAFGCADASSESSSSGASDMDRHASSSSSSSWSSSWTDALDDSTTCHTGDSFAAFLGFDPRRRWLNVLGLASLSILLFVCSVITMGTARSWRHMKRTNTGSR